MTEKERIALIETARKLNKIKKYIKRYIRPILVVSGTTFAIAIGNFVATTTIANSREDEALSYIEDKKKDCMTRYINPINGSGHSMLNADYFANVILSDITENELDEIAILKEIVSFDHRLAGELAVGEKDSEGNTLEVIDVIVTKLNENGINVNSPDEALIRLAERLGLDFRNKSLNELEQEIMPLIVDEKIANNELEKQGGLK